MANSLLDFVMSLVRDPDAAARYQADPSQAIADAHLTDVTSADVNGLIPVVKESLSMGAPVAGADPAHDSNVWASGAATAAFDAFSDHLPVVDDGHHLVADPIEMDHPLISSPEYPAETATDLHVVDAANFDHTAQVDDFHIDDSGSTFADPGTVDHPLFQDHPVVANHDMGTDAPNFDIFG
jgi:hypothetical protein